MNYRVVSLSPQLPNEEDPEGSPQVAAEAPPPYSSIAVDNAGKTVTHPDVSLVLRNMQWWHIGESYLWWSAPYCY